MRGTKPAGFSMMFTVAAVLAISGTATAGQISTFEMAQNNPPSASGEGSGMAQKPGRADEPKKYQPVNPAPDPRTAPTSSSTGVGASSGGRPEQQPATK